ncbi:MAG: HU family DNA-binding protein [Gloeomargarita sp. SKYBB_i_bin120]|nr:HU family DNA-binding protein [Gloeomargarita sp. SKYG98]MCS7291540.1 HU family DNA-binding protein [Gloeomargarita sp. SKYB120]MDW8177100.1 HU family DNA-binding protein [Gloeomargarita sp. SKYBB_i_bin120]
MNKGELVELVAQNADLPKKVVDTVITEVFNTIIETVSAGEKVTLVGFGSFEVRKRQAREGRNPRTGEPMKIPATQVPVFSAGKQFKERVSA